MNPTELTTDEILNKLEEINKTRNQTINGIRVASIFYDKLHEELDRRDYNGDRPSRAFNPKFRRNS